jgi:hypothetical protein
MGQFLSIGLAHEIVTSLEEIREKNISKEELRQEIEQTMLFDMQLAKSMHVYIYQAK